MTPTDPPPVLSVPLLPPMSSPFPLDGPRRPGFHLLRTREVALDAIVRAYLGRRGTA